MLLVAFLAAAAAGVADGWEIHQAERFCLLRQTARAPGGAELGIALDIRSKARLVLTNPAWQVEADRSYPLAAGIESSMKARKARGLKLGADWVALVADVDEQGFVEQFANAAAIQFEVRKVKPGTVAGRFPLAGAAGAAQALRACQTDLIAKSADLAKHKLDQRKRPIPESHNEDPDDTIPDR
jgi:hypothetical protein